MSYHHSYHSQLGDYLRAYETALESILREGSAAAGLTNLIPVEESRQSLGPSHIENPALIERFVKLIPLPDPLAALVWSAVIPSGPVFYIIQYLVSGGYPLSLANAILNLFLPFYLFVTVRYLRLRVVASEAPIAARLSGGMQDYEREFGRMTHQSRSSC